MLYPKFIWFVVFDVFGLGHHTSLVCSHSSSRSVLQQKSPPPVNALMVAQNPQMKTASHCEQLDETQKI
jgi:hypothetical protein